MVAKKREATRKKDLINPKVRVQICLHPAAYGRLIKMAEKNGFTRQWGEGKGKAKPSRLIAAWLEQEMGIEKMAKQTKEKYITIAENFIE